MKNDSLISIVVPVYQGEKYLRACMDSILNQTYRNYEVILIDDGSSDSSHQICCQYCEQDTRFRVYRQENQGVCAARNNGMSYARGKYLAWIDCDDFVEPGYLQHFVEALEETGADFAISGYQRIVQNKLVEKKETAFHQLLLNREEYLDQWFYKEGSYYFSVLWNKMYRRSFLEKNGIRFDKNIKLGEDFLFNLKVLAACSRIANISYAEYQYMFRENSLVNKPQNPIKYWKNIKVLYKGYQELLKKIGNPNDSAQILDSYLQGYMIGLMGKMREDKRPFRQRIAYIRKIYQNDPDVQKNAHISYPDNRSRSMHNFILRNKLFALNELYYVVKELKK